MGDLNFRRAHALPVVPIPCYESEGGAGRNVFSLAFPVRKTSRFSSFDHADNNQPEDLRYRREMRNSMPKLEQVFGVSTGNVLSYLEREDVDGRFVEALKADKQIIVYGSSKQGKTSLVQKYLPYSKNIVVRLTPKMSIADIYASVLRQLGIRLKTGITDTQGRESAVSLKAGFKALIPIFGGGEASTEGRVKATNELASDYEEVPFNLELPQDVSELVRKVKSQKAIILENFHYLNDEGQKQLAYDLRTFQELNIRFVILGVWREKNRLVQFNGDLIDRIIEIPVEPWHETDFYKVAEKGEKELRVKISPEILGRCCEASFSSIGVFQELLKEMCLLAGIRETQDIEHELSNSDTLARAIERKAQEYAARHQRALESIAAGNVGGGGGREGRQPLYLPYYLVKVILQSGYDALAEGMRRATIQERIQKIHHRPDKEDVRASDMSNLLHNLAALQSAKNISPPIIDYDQNTKMLQVVDSTFYFFLKNADLKLIENEIPSPLIS